MLDTTTLWNHKLRPALAWAELTLALVCLLLPGQAFAASLQTDAVPTEGASEQSATRLSPLREAPPRLPRDTSQVLDPIFQQASEVWGNPYGGADQEVVYTGLLQIGLRGDLGEAGWVSGLSFGAVGLWVQGGNISKDSVGDTGIVSNIAGAEAVRLFKAWLRQRWLAGGIDLKAGLIPADDDFMVLDSAQLFINSGFGTLQSEALNIPVGIYPLASLGARVVIQPSDAWEVRLGAYDGDAGVGADHPHLADLALDVDQGITLFSEWTWHGTLAGSRSRITLGGFAHLGLLRDHLDQFQEFNRERRNRGLGNIYLMLERRLAHWSGSDLTAFGHASFAFPEARAVVRRYADVGLVLGGGPWRRPHDRFGLGYAWTGFGDAYLRNTRSRGNRVTDVESVLELTYRLGLLPWIHVQPSVQWVFDPHFSHDNALTLALRTSVTF